MDATDRQTAVHMVGAYIYVALGATTHQGRTSVKMEVIMTPIKMSAILAYRNFTEPWLPGVEVYCNNRQNP